MASLLVGQLQRFADNANLIQEFEKGAERLKGHLA